MEMGTTSATPGYSPFRIHWPLGKLNLASNRILFISVPSGMKKGIVGSFGRTPLDQWTGIALCS